MTTNNRGGFIDLTGQRFGRWAVQGYGESRQGIAYWLCECECGTRKSVNGHSLRSGQSASCGECGRPDLATRFWAKAFMAGPDDCWPWLGYKQPSGYGKFRIGSNADGSRKMELAHRLAWVLFYGDDIPPGMQIDHLCRNRGCVNPSHLEVVTPQENTIRGTAAQRTRETRALITHCPQGHPYAGDNLHLSPSGKRRCRACGRAATARWSARQ